jgi:hypothetical protein
MIDPRRAQGLLKALRFAKENLRDGLKEAANWHATPYQSQEAAAYDSFESDYGLPANLDVSTPPEVAFPPPDVILSGGGLAAGVEGPAFDLSSRAQRSGVEEPALSLSKGPAFSPYVRDYEAEAELAMNVVQPEDIELTEIRKKYGYKAWDERAKEHQRNERRRRQRKYFRANYDRFVAEANAKNVQKAAEKLYQERVAAEAAAATKKPPAGTAEFSLDEAKNTA